MDKKELLTDPKALARLTPAGFAGYASDNKWILARHLAVLNRKLIGVASGRIKRLLVNMGPRHGKSEFISKYFPAWFLGTYPDKRIIFTSYEASFAAQYGAAVRDLIDEYGEEMFGIRIKSNQRAAARWFIEDVNGKAKVGGMYSVGANGPITGKGCDLLLIDDPIKNNEEADSPLQREKLYDWFCRTAYSRLQPGGSIVLVQTRWHSLLAGNKVTIDGKLKNIEDVKIEDNVLTSNGYEKTLGTTSHEYSGKIYSIKTWYTTEDLKVTEEHRIKTRDGWKEARNLTLEDYIELPFDSKFYDNFDEVINNWSKDPEIAAKNQDGLSISGYHNRVTKEQLKELLVDRDLTYREAAVELGFKDRKSVYEYATLYGLNRLVEQCLPKEVVYKPLFWRIVGYWLAEGSLDGNSKKHGKSRVTFSFNSKETYYVEDIKELFKEYDIEVYIEYHKKYKSMQARVSSYQFAEFLKQFGTSAGTKNIPEFIFKLPKEHISEFIKGYFEGDGHLEESRGQASFSSISYNLLYNLQRLFLKFNKICGLTVSQREAKKRIIEGRICNTNKSYNLYFPIYDMGWEDYKRDKKYRESYYSYITENKAYIKIKNIGISDYSGTVYDIKTPSSDFIVNLIQTHNCDDLTGRILEQQKKGGEKWEHINFPAIAEKDEIFEKGLFVRKKGEALWPEVWNLEALERIKATMGEYGFSALYGQNPVPIGGGIFKEKWFRYYTSVGDYLHLASNNGSTSVNIHNCRRFITIDTANKDKISSDFSVIAEFLVTPKNDLILYNLHRERYNWDILVKKCITVSRQFNPEYMGIENLGIGIALANELVNKGLAIRRLEPMGKSKQNRANAPMGLVVRMEEGKVYFPKDAPYLFDIQKELLSFPKGANDDIADVLSYAANELTKLDLYDSGDFCPYTITTNQIGVTAKPGNYNNFSGY